MTYRDTLIRFYHLARKTFFLLQGNIQLLVSFTDVVFTLKIETVRNNTAS